MGKEEKWQKTQENLKLELSQEEWASVYAIAQGLKKNKGYQGSFKITRKDLKGENLTQVVKNHSFIVIPDTSNPAGYKIGVLARAKKYENEGEFITEGIVGHGSSGVTKSVFWQDGTSDIVKIEPHQEGETNSVEIAIMRRLGQLKADFVRTKEDRHVTESTEWIAEKKVGTKAYKIMPRLGSSLTDYLEGQFKQELQSLSGPEQDLKRLKIALEIAEEIKHLHDKGIVHYDIKPDNFLIQRIGTTDKIKINAIDFGTSEILPEDGSVVTKDFVSGSKGTVGFMAPEVAYGKDLKISKDADVYSFGVLLKRLDLRFALVEKDGAKKHLLIDEMMKKDGERPSITQVITKLTNKIIELEKKRDLLATNQTFTTPVQAGTLPTTPANTGEQSTPPLPPPPLPAIPKKIQQHVLSKKSVALPVASLRHKEGKLVGSNDGSPLNPKPSGPKQDV